VWAHRLGLRVLEQDREPGEHRRDLDGRRREHREPLPALVVAEEADRAGQREGAQRDRPEAGRQHAGTGMPPPDQQRRDHDPAGDVEQERRPDHVHGAHALEPEDQVDDDGGEDGDGGRVAQGHAGNTESGVRRFDRGPILYPSLVSKRGSAI
jgi:hypothetical protein